jgi:hypothetical protein
MAPPQGTNGVRAQRRWCITGRLYRTLSCPNEKVASTRAPGKDLVEAHSSILGGSQSKVKIVLLLYKSHLSLTTP